MQFPLETEYRSLSSALLFSHVLNLWREAANEYIWPWGSVCSKRERILKLCNFLFLCNAICKIKGLYFWGYSLHCWREAAYSVIKHLIALRGWLGTCEWGTEHTSGFVFRYWDPGSGLLDSLLPVRYYPNPSAWNSWKTWHLRAIHSRPL